MLRTGSAGKGAGGSVSVLVGNGKKSAGGRIVMSAGETEQTDVFAVTQLNVSPANNNITLTQQSMIV